MKIVFTTDQVYLHGGIEKVMATKANYFADVLGYEVYVITTEQKGNKPCYSFSEKVKFIDLEINYIRTKSYFSRFNLKKIPQHFLKWSKAIKKINPDFIIVCNLAFDYYWTPFFYRKINKIKEFHASRFYSSIERKKKKGMRKLPFIINDFIESKYDVLVLLNKDEEQFYNSNNLIVIPNPINTTNQKTADLVNLKAIAAGRIAPVKGFEKAIAVWKIVVSECPEWKLDIFGQGETDYIEGLQMLIRKNNLQHNVFIHDAVSDLHERMLDYSFYLMTSKTECFPMILLEAMSLGLPLLSFDCPYGPRNIITNKKDGFLVEDQNVTRLAESCINIISDLDLRCKMGHQAKENVVVFGVANVMQRWIDLFHFMSK
ncbi:glycosyltransferase [Flavobacterium sp. NRK F7]|uniref:glycosyltransferase n=1 Tax=Flavobacterium sp. NRK F7 TaxID=2954930 RepID=UPI002090DDE0|nr:glycosyltransferase [Flavobacterium sp. NRK F7]MCO6164226.1 glycosyltransferase [Flavobacterium sp. NRK F7]